MEVDKQTKALIRELKNPGQMVTRITQTSAFQYFFNKISQAGFLLLGSAFIALAWSNLAPQSYHHFWHQELTIHLGNMALHHSLVHWVNDALMAIFFFTVGLEIKREFLVGGLSDPKRASLPIAAAVGGMVVPASIYVLINGSGQGASGWGIPMATDIAFSLAIISILGSKVPFGVRLFLTALAIVDDLGAIIVIALFYTPEIHLDALGISGGITFLLFLCNRLGVRQSFPYLILGLLLWFAISHAGLHATIAGVITAMFIPSQGKYNTDIFLDLVRERMQELRCEGESCVQSVLVNRKHLNAVQDISIACKEVETPLQRLEHSFSSWVGYLILPVFALANGGVALLGLEFSTLAEPITLGIILGLVIGKPLGIFTFTFVVAKVLKTNLIQGTNWTQILGAGMLGGIGFTMSLFISNLSFTDGALIEYSKVGIMLGSFLSALFGYSLLRFSR